jgi:hypothetical protein
MTLAFTCHADFDDEICEMGSKLKAIAEKLCKH